MNGNIVVRGNLASYHFLRGMPMVVSHGEFTILNNSNSVKSFLIEKCWFEKDDVKIELDLFHIYHENTSMSNPFDVTAKTSFDFRVTFPFQMIESGRGDYRLLIRIKMDGQLMDAESKIEVFEEL